MPAPPSLADLDVGGRKVLLRLDLNVPAGDMTRLERAVPTLRGLAERGARTVVLTHYGRPQGRDEDLSVGFLAAPLAEALQADVAFASDCVGAGPERLAERLRPGETALFENLRFHRGETANAPAFAAALARAGDVYVNDAFSAAHRAHASTVGLPKLLPAAAGPAMAAEIAALESALDAPERPVMAIVGGAKASTKIALLGNLASRVDVLAIGGAMANTFLAARGASVGASLHEKDMFATALQVLARAEAAGCDVVLPVDATVAESPAGAPSIAAIGAIPADRAIYDVGPDTADLIGNRIPQCRTLLWNGPLGLFETPPFDTSTVLVARTAAAMTRAGGLTSVAGGGDTAAALAHAGAMGGFTFVSVAGGAFLEWLEGKTLPGVAALRAAGGAAA